MLPNFLVIGAPRAGTTSMYEYLRPHPEIFMPQIKEPHLFATEEAWRQRRDWYEGLFAGAGDAKAVGEASATYSQAQVYPGVPERIAQTLPDARFVYLLRHPIERLESEYHYYVAAGTVKAPLDRVVFRDQRLLANSMYAFQMDRYLDHFDRKRMLTPTLEDIRDRPHETVRSVLEFLGVDPDWTSPATGRVFNLTLRASTSSLSPEAREAVLERLRPDLQRLRAHLGERFHCWGLLD